jgi:hypothetical protein
MGRLTTPEAPMALAAVVPEPTPPLVLLRVRRIQRTKRVVHTGETRMV